MGLIAVLAADHLKMKREELKRVEWDGGFVIAVGEGTPSSKLTAQLFVLVASLKIAKNGWTSRWGSGPRLLKPSMRHSVTEATRL